MNSRLSSIIRKEFIQIRRDPRTLALVFVIPVMQLILMGYTATTDVRNVHMAVFDLDRGPAAAELLEAYRAADYFLLTHFVQSEDELRELIDAGDATAGLIIPPDFSEAIRGGENSEVVVFIDGSDPAVAANSLSAAQLISQEHGATILAERLGGARGLETPIQARTQVWYNPEMRSSFFMVPGVIGMILYFLTSMLTASAVVRERERGTIEQLIVTPIRSWELIVGKMLPYVILAFINTLEVLILGSLLFEVPIRGNIALILALSALLLLSGLGIGLLASTLASTQQEAMLIVYMTLLPSIFLSGFFFPIQAMPQLLQWASALVPIRYYMVIIRSLMLKGVGFQPLQDEALTLAVFGVVILLAASLRFRKRLD
jgi:ABC-2 type transport system permease protein